jgi:hypothetical protein
MYFEPRYKNVRDVPFIRWKGKTLTQITSSIQKNTLTRNTPYNIFRRGVNKKSPLPLKIYRREIATAKSTSCNERRSASIDEFNRPMGYLVRQNATIPNSQNMGIVNTLDINLVNNTTEIPGLCRTLTSVCQDPASNARRRVRSAGMIRKVFSPNAITTPYCINNSQYLRIRGKQFEVNQYNFLARGSAQTVPGDPASRNNVYRINTGLNYCPNPNTNFIPVYYKPNNYQYAQQGSVSSSARTARLNYNTVTTNGGLFRTAFGTNAERTLSSGISTDKYTIKDKIGYPTNSTPVFSKACNTPACRTVPFIYRRR